MNKQQNFLLIPHFKRKKHKGVGNKSCVIPRGEDGLRGLCSGLLISIVLGLQTTQKQTKILDRLQS